MHAHLWLHRRGANQPLNTKPRCGEVRHFLVERGTNLELKLEVVVRTTVKVHGLFSPLVVDLAEGDAKSALKARGQQVRLRTTCEHAPRGAVGAGATLVLVRPLSKYHPADGRACQVRGARENTDRIRTPSDRSRPLHRRLGYFLRTSLQYYLCVATIQPRGHNTVKNHRRTGVAMPGRLHQPRSSHPS